MIILVVVFLLVASFASGDSEESITYPRVQCAGVNGALYCGGKAASGIGSTYMLEDDRAIKRDRKVVRAFLKKLGRKTTPPGAQVDHIIPLSCGGADSVNNLQLIWGNYKTRKETAERDCETISEWIEENPCSSGECVKPALEAK